MQFFRVQHAQFGVSVFNAVHVLHGPVETVEHNDTVCRNHGVGNDGLCIVKVPEPAKVPLAPRVHDQTPVKMKMMMTRGRGLVAITLLQAFQKCFILKEFTK